MFSWHLPSCQFLPVPVPCPHTVSGLPAHPQTPHFKISRICSLDVFCLLYFLSCLGPFLLEPWDELCRHEEHQHVLHAGSEHAELGRVARSLDDVLLGPYSRRVSQLPLESKVQSFNKLQRAVYAKTSIC